MKGGLEDMKTTSRTSQDGVAINSILSSLDKTIKNQVEHILASVN
jgi:hypothetical protein